MIFRRIFVIVIDGCGIGGAPDAAEFGDSGADTLGNCAKASGGIHAPVLESLGLGNLGDLRGIRPIKPEACYGSMIERNKAKNTDAGHWEMMGFVKEPPFRRYPEGFPADLISLLREKTGKDFIGNYPASGTEIIEKLGPEHLSTGKIIIYTSGDSVLQLAAHDSILSHEELYDICRIAREICVGPWEIGRVIARPFTGKPGSFRRKNDLRKDFPLMFSSDTLLDALKDAGLHTIAYGEVGELFDMKGITRYQETKDNRSGMRFLMQLLDEDFKGMVFGNLVDTDQLYGHRRDPDGYSRCIEELDAMIGRFISQMKPDDLLMITGDHGNDPTFRGTDHTRERVPLLVYGGAKGNYLGERKSFSDLGRTIAENFDVRIDAGDSFLGQVRL